MKRKWTWIAAAILPMALLACSTDETTYDPDWAADETMEAGKADGLIDIAMEIEFDQVVTGSVGGDRIEVFRMHLTRNDKILLEETVTSGDLNPHMTLFFGTSTYVSSDDWERDGDVLRKWYTAESTGKYLLALRAYQGQGEGTYSVKATCLAGPCNGDPNDPPEEYLSYGEVSHCLLEARECAFVNMLQYNGAVGEARAAKLLQDCLDDIMLDDGITCASACEETSDDPWDSSPASVCDDIKAGIIFYADQSEDCIEQLNICMWDCVSYGDYGIYEYFDEFWTAPVAICWSTGLNGSCDGYARDHESCGGDRYGIETPGECFEMCESTIGAWIDDLDTICDEDCDGKCQAELDTCEEECEDPDCVDGCMQDHEDWCWWD
jgi:hypothetical protein